MNSNPIWWQSWVVPEPGGNWFVCLCVGWQQQGYRTGLFGKYLNGYGFTLTDPATGQNLSANRVPLGWEEWWSFKNIGYFNYTASVNGTHT